MDFESRNSQEEEWPLEDAHANLAHAKTHAEDCAECEPKHGMVDRIDAELSFTRDLSDQLGSELPQSGVFASYSIAILPFPAFMVSLLIPSVHRPIED